MKKQNRKRSIWRGFVLSIMVLLLASSPGKTAEDVLTYYDNTHGSLSYSGSWTSQSGWPKAYGTTVSWSNAQNNQVALNFTGNSITRLYSMTYNRGSAEIFIDGSSQGVFSDYSPTTIWQAARTWSFPQGAHTIAVKVAGGGYIDLDAFIVDIPTVSDGIYDNTSTQFKYIGNWTNSSPWSSAYNQTLSWSNDIQSVVNFTFSGDVVTLYFTKTTNRGFAAIIIDGIHKGEYDLFSSNTIWKDSLTFANLGVGIHTINIAVTGNKNSLSTGQYVDVDAIRVGTVSTPVQCPGDPKYGCTYARHVPSLNGAYQLIHSRLYAGGRDGGAQQWQLYWAKDQEYVNSNWQTSESFSSGQWYTNIQVGPYYSSGTQRTRIYNSRVQMKYRYYECVPGQPCYYWCSVDATHYLINDSSVNTGSAACYL